MMHSETFSFLGRTASDEFNESSFFMLSNQKQNQVFFGNKKV